MKGYIEERVREIAEYITATGTTVRQAAAEFGVSKSTVHKDMRDRIEELNPLMARRVREVLQKNMDERHIRGGIATRRKYKGE